MSMRPLRSQTWSIKAVKLFPLYAALCVASPALAAEAIGSAVAINRSVTGAVSGKPYPMSVGDAVKRDEWVRTDASGEARLNFVDSTNLVIFSGSAIRLTRFSSNSVVMTTSDGTFAFNTGNSPSGAYRINTPAGTLIPHSRFTFTVQGGRIRLDVQEGDVTFCPSGKSKASCVEATPGHPVVGQAGAPAQIEGGPPPTPPVYRQATPINYGSPSGSGGPSGCVVRTAADLRFSCGTQTGGWRNWHGGYRQQVRTGIYHPGFIGGSGVSYRRHYASW